MAPQSIESTIQYAVFSCLYPAVGCSLYATAVLHASGSLFDLVPIPVIVLAVVLGIHHVWLHRSAESIRKLVRGNLTLFAIFTLGAAGIMAYAHFALKT